jgi:spore maturation protein CgeB
MRILVIDTYYPAFLEDHYAANPGLAERAHSEQLESLAGRCFGTSDAYSRHFRELGHESAEYIVNWLPLQVAWEGENGFLARVRRQLGARFGSAPEGDQLLHEITMTQIAAYDPDLLYVQDTSFFEPEELERLRRRGIGLAGQVGSAPEPDVKLEGYDLLLTCLGHLVEDFRALGVSSELLRIGFHEAVLGHLHADGVDTSPASPREYGVVFVGGFNPDVHEHRLPMLETVGRATELDVWGYGAEQLPPSSPVLRSYRGQAWGLDMYRIFAGARIVINAHEEISKGEAANMRMYEATGTGALLITEDHENLPEMFEPGREVVTYTDLDDLVDKVEYYLEHDDERVRIATAGQARALSEHTYGHRIAELDGILGRYFPAR